MKTPDSLDSLVECVAASRITNALSKSVWFNMRIMSAQCDPVILLMVL